jgi:His-Xaa-Ser system radical SAM maturase HxsC
MKLTTSGLAGRSFHSAVVGKVSWQPVPRKDRNKFILLSKDIPADREELRGYRGFLTTAKPTADIEAVPTMFSAQELDHLRTNDIVAMEPANGFIRTLYRPDSSHNVVFATQRCNSNCLMCSQPPRDRDDTEALLQRNLELIRLIDTPPSRLVITGGEPTLLGDRLFKLIAALRDKFPTTYLHMLTNGRMFAWSSYTAGLAKVGHPDFMFGIPLYSDDPGVHDYVVQARGAFDQTVLGFQQLARYGVRVEIRVVLHAITIPRLSALADYIYRNFTFAEHVALMGLENIGYAPRNMGQLWIDPADYQDQLESAVEILSTRGLNVSIYNHQLCVLRKSLWKFARKSISDWKNMYLEECAGCGVRDQCGGFFQWATKLHSAHIHALPAHFDGPQ